jgi:hypothetical protein
MFKNKIILSVFFALAFTGLRAQVIPVDAVSAGGNFVIANYPGNFTGPYDGFTVIFRSNHNSPGACTMNIGGLGAKPIINTAGAVLAAGDIKSGQVVTIIYDLANIRYQMITTSGNAGGGGITGSGTVGRVALFTGSGSLGNSIIVDDGTNVGVGIAPAGTFKLQVNGKVGSTGINETSDLRYKKNIFTIENPVQKVLALRGVNYFWRTDEFKEKNFDSTAQIGLIAQEVEKIIPQVVATDANGFKSVEYSKLVALLIEAIKEQQKKIEALSAENQTLKNNSSATGEELRTLKADVKSLHDAIDILLKESISLKTTGQK